MGFDKPDERVPTVAQYIFGGTAGMAATCLVQPFHLVKNRMQLSTQEHYRTKNTFQLTRLILQKEGFKGIYHGLCAGLLRQAIYSSTKLGLYATVCSHYESSPGLLEKVGIGMSSGCLAAVAASPTELAIVRMTVDGPKVNRNKYNYRSVFHCFQHVRSNDGLFYLWKGTVPSILRSMVVTAAQLSSYSQTKEILDYSGYITSQLAEQILSGFGSAVFTVFASLPMDNIKTKIQGMKMKDCTITVGDNKKKKSESTGTLDVMRTIVRREGFFSLWRGFTPYFMKLGPHTILTFICVEQLNSNYIKFVVDSE